MQRILFLLLVSFTAAAAGAAELFPLQPGAVWEYRAEKLREPLIIRVGSSQLYADGKTYSRLTGYTTEPLWVRLNENGDLVFLDEERGRERLLTSFIVDSSAWFEAPFRPCDQEGQAHSDRVPYSGLTGSIATTVAIRYRSFGCGDGGVETEQFAANIGMVSRIVSTLAGPVVYKLVYADTGAVQLAPRDAATLRLALARSDERTVTARLRFTADPATAPKLVFGSQQEFDMILRDESGRQLWRWSDGLAFLQIVREVQAANLSYEAEIPIQNGETRLPPGVYTVEAWLTTIDADRAPRTMGQFQIQGSSTPRAVLPARARR